MRAVRPRRRKLDPGWYAKSAAAHQKRQRKQAEERAARRTPPAGDVTIISADGTIRVEPALVGRHLRAVVKERPPISAKLRHDVLGRDGYSCRYCGYDGPVLEIEHVVPIAKGGATNLSNLVAACGPCNRKKGTAVWKPNPLPRRRRRASPLRS
ncbi:HNH endonuclease [Nocardia noduli]|uniref:HNH endonuclease n=1 Tax=Nocardia noduli TaxID=2815722 RepID=UPI001C22910B